MRRLGTGLVELVALVALVAALAPGAASAAGNRKLVEGTVYDTTCATACVPECPPPPHCGPITQARAAIVCAQRRKRIVACPLAGSSASESSSPICLPSSNCGGYPIYSGEGATVNVRRRGSSTVLTTLPVVEGHFKIRLGPGEYVLHPHLPEEPCMVGVPATVKVTPRARGPIPVSLTVGSACVVHPGAAK